MSWKLHTYNNCSFYLSLDVVRYHFYCSGTRRQGRILEHFKLPSAARLHRLSAPFLAFQLQCHSSIILSFIYLNIPFFIARRPSQQGCVIPMSHFWFLLLYQAATFHLDLANTTFEGKNTMRLCDEHDFYCSGRYRMCGWRFYWWFVRQALTMASVLVSFLLAPVRQKPDKSQQRCVIQKDTLRRPSDPVGRVWLRLTWQLFLKTSDFWM